jgi:thymidine phosphorylase
VSDLDELRAKVREIAGAVAEASANLAKTENPAKEASAALLELNGEHGDPDLHEAYAHLATALTATAQAFNSYQAAWDVLNRKAPL